MLRRLGWTMALIAVAGLGISHRTRALSAAPDQSEKIEFVDVAASVGIDLTTFGGTKEKRHILERLNATEALERFLATKYVGQKRFGIDGAESAVPILDAILGEAADASLDSAVIGMK